ncbi:MAG: SCO6745 family protein [Actinomycetota bacterium]
MRAVDGALLRHAYRVAETYHAVVYFAPETKEHYTEAGLKGGWMGYFASRAAALGPVQPEIVEALFFNFHPTMVRRAIPDAWGFSNPERVIEARLRVADAALRRILDDDVEDASIGDALDIARDALQACSPQGRALFAAYLSLPWPEASHLGLWHACTLLREYRGDGHIAALVTSGLDGLEAHILAVGVGRFPRAGIQPFRGWSDDEWATAEQRLQARGLIDGSGIATAAGSALRDRIEDLTDELSSAPWQRVGPERTERFDELMTPLARRIVAGQAIPFPNPMGLKSTN